ncbi:MULTISPECIES: hypothetical protein [Marinobacter]|uniref:Uncharacterized protein n=1 Tax=Marinobacter xiaoshiensis TaxID=3073652 RepID=A0ABU2HI64_9GAMM|nr:MULTISPECIES: hypothetical protein [unclassified Marinobacter]MBK1874302.1 hypothetical protein [Marinobacter sp. 1-3A]MBK1887477.1 hypothetical protein [Marinobacter sp. DY40_1A1]MDS1310246.1 hypothetical protein [Marinobacter sp. F60267]
MFWTLVATVFCGLGAAGIALGIRVATRNMAPKWIIPVFAGIGMLGYLIYGEYTWFDHKQSRLPDEAVVVSTERKGIFWRPWSLVYPYVTAFSTVDTNSIGRGDTSNPNIVRFTLYRFEQKITDAVSHRVHIINCATRELVPLGSDGTPRIDNLKVLERSDELYSTVCSS